MTEIPVPPPELRRCGKTFKTGTAFTDTGIAEAIRLVDRCGFHAASRILDVGCGAGRLPLGIINHYGPNWAGPEGRYTGIDPDRKAIDWCRANMDTREYRFLQFDTQHDRFNPDGPVEITDVDFQLPFRDEAFTIIYAHSLFAHFTPEPLDAYLNEFRRLLTPDGIGFFTVHVEHGYGIPNVSVNPAGYPERRMKANRDALHCVRYNEEYFRLLVNRWGLSVIDWTHDTEWRHQSAFYVKRAK